jgi:Thiamine pyrophosphate enzyme, C-terminal TPP binding domain
LRFQPASLMSLETPERPVIAFTGDGGLMMGAGELSTAAHHAARLASSYSRTRSFSIYYKATFGKFSSVTLRRSRCSIPQLLASVTMPLGRLLAT